MNNKVIIAAAGSGKTTHLVEEALKITDKKVLITTFTIAAEKEIRAKIIEENNFLPDNITVQTWFSALLQHGVRPYQNYVFDGDIKGMNLVSGQSAPYTRGDAQEHYFDSRTRIYSDKISKFVLKCNNASDGKVINRLSKIYAHIFIDEVQDLSGYDFCFLELLFDSDINILLVGDPRQSTYLTSNSPKNKQYAGFGITDFFQKIECLVIDEESLIVNHRSIPDICDFSNRLFLDYPQTTSDNTEIPEHTGVFLVRPTDVAQYLEQYNPIQLRYSRNTPTNDAFDVMNFGNSKGLSFDRVLIYPTKNIRDWLKDNTSPLPPTSRSKLYVAITRAQYSVAFVYDYEDGETIAGVANHPSYP